LEDSVRLVKALMALAKAQRVLASAAVWAALDLAVWAALTVLMAQMAQMAVMAVMAAAAATADARWSGL
jgi:hypothetical protein